MQSALPFYHSWVGLRKDSFMAFLKVLAGSEIQTALSRMWSLVVASVSYKDPVKFLKR